MRKYKKLISDTVVFALGGIGSKMILFFLVPIYTKYLTTEEYGTAELILTVSSILIPIVSLNIDSAILRFEIDKKNPPKDVLKIGIRIAVIGSIILIAITPFFDFYSTIAQWKWYMCVYVISYIFHAIMTIYLKATGRNKLFAVLQILLTLLTAILNILFLVFFDWKIRGYLLANILSLLAVFLIAVVFGEIYKKPQFGRSDKALAKQMLTYSMPLIFNSIAWFVLQYSDKIMIEILISTSALGLYTAASKIPSFVNTFSAFFSQAWTLSAVGEYEKDNNSAFFGNVFDIYVILLGGIALIVNMIIKPFMRVYVGVDYFSAWKLVPILIAGAVFSAISSFFSVVYSALKKSKNTMITTLISAVVNLALNYILISVIGILGAVIATCISHILIVVLRVVDTRRFFRFCIDFKRLLASLVLVLAQSVLVTLNFHIYMVSAVCIVIYILINAKTLKKLISLVNVKGKNKYE